MVDAHTNSIIKQRVSIVYPNYGRLSDSILVQSTQAMWEAMMLMICNCIGDAHCDEGLREQIIADDDNVLM